MEVSNNTSRPTMQQVQAPQKAQEVQRMQAQEQQQAESSRDTQARNNTPPPRETVNNQGQRIGTRLNAVA